MTAKEAKKDRDTVFRWSDPRVEEPTPSFSSFIVVIVFSIFDPNLWTLTDLSTAVAGRNVAMLQPSSGSRARTTTKDENDY
jgi:hypothetical protein